MEGNRLSAADFLTKSLAIPVLDVRSPGEYESGHIPAAVSFPLFTNEERAIIGTLYKQEGRQSAIKKGLEIVGPKMLGFIEQAEALGKQALALYCWRGGMRSDSMAWLLERYGFQTFLLEGGYKAYRNQMLRFFEQDLPLRVITGYTGSQKTALLHLLEKRGAQVIDLEGLAQHQGSSFGNQKSKEQPPNEHFQNLVFEAFRKLDLTRPIWIEDEDMRLGTVNIVESLFRRIDSSPHFLLDIEQSQRVAFLVEDYGDLSKEQLIRATNGIRKRLGFDKASKAIKHIEAGAFQPAAEIILTYYDSRYHRTLTPKKHLIQEKFRIDSKDLPKLADKLMKMTEHGI